MEKISGGQIAAEALQERGVDCIFTLSGGHITPLYKHLVNTTITLFDTRHEQSAVFMAEAYGRMKRKPGIALVTAGPGFTNALTAVQNANMANSPLVVISGVVGVDSCEKLDLQDMRQAPVIEPMVKKALVCHKAERIAEFIDMAYRTAITGRPGPVYLELPVDVLKAEVPVESVKKIKTVVKSQPGDPVNAIKIIEMLKDASNPVIVAGSGAWYADAGEELTTFVEKTGIPVFTSAAGRGVIPDSHPLCFESSSAIRPGAALVGATSSDLVLMLGGRLSLNFIFGDIFPKEAKFIQVDINPEEIGRNRTADLGVIADVKGLLKDLIVAVDRMSLATDFQAKFKTWITTLQGAEKESKAQSSPLWESDAKPIHAMRVAHEINRFLNRDDDILVADGGDTSVWSSMTRTANHAGHYLDSGIFGCLGVGIPYANAAKFLNPNSRVCLVTGDASTGFNFMEFETAIRKHLPIVVVIANDLGWGMIRHSQELSLGKAIETGTYIGEVPYHKLVEDLGGLGLYVDKAEDIAPALEKAFASGKTACINIMTDTTTISPGSVALASLGSYSA